MSISSVGGTTTVAMTYPQSTERRQPPTLTDTAALLGISTDQLSSDLQSGQTLSSLAGTAGVSSSDLLSSVEADLKANAPDGAPALSDTQLANMATNLINGAGPGQSSGSTAMTASNLNTLADAAGLDPSDLLDQIHSGDDLSALLGSFNQTQYGSTVADAINGGVIFDQYA
jgi:uncharacterized protein YidB (DUF937 family)